MAYMMKAAVVYSFAWKAATGVAAAEGLALGGWGCSSVHKQKAAAAQCAAELVRIRSQAARELASLRGLLQQREAAHEEQVRAGDRGASTASGQDLCCLMGRELCASTG